MVTETREQVDGQAPSVWAPLRNRVYRNLFIAAFASNIGTWMQSVAAQWFLVEKDSSEAVVALVQTAGLGPALLFGLFAGALADLFDRRRLLIFLQSYAVVVALALAVVTHLGRLTPTSLLMFTVAIGCASALAAPDWQAIQPEVVSREQIPAVAMLGSFSGNASRAIGPAIGGLITAFAGPAAVFTINALSFAAIIVALRTWKRPKQLAPVERERFGQAIASGLRYVRNGPTFRRILLRTGLFLFPATGMLALLPVVAKRTWHLGADGYGVALGAIGFGALLGALVASLLRLRMSDNMLLAVSAAAYALAPLAVVWLPFLAAIPFLILSGTAWLITLATLNSAAQLTLPQWVRARALAVYLLVSTGAQALGAYAWGAFATWTGRDVALLCSAATLAGVAVSVFVFPLLPNTGKLNIDVSAAWPEPMVMFEPRPNDGPVLVTVHYRVSAENQADFVTAMGRVRRSRLRTGGHSWRLYNSLGDTETFLERFTVASWSEFERQRTERWLGYDSDNFTAAVSYTVDHNRTDEYYVAKRVPR